MPGLSSTAAVTCAAAFVFGVLLALLGAIKLQLAKRLDIGEGRVGGLLAALNLALIPMMLVSGVLIDALGVRLVLVAGSLLAAVAVVSLSIRRSYVTALVCVLLLGAGAACLSTASVVLMPVAFGFARNELAASVNLGLVFVALGALMTPTLADLLLRTLGFRWTLGLAGLVCLAPALAAALCDLPAAPAEKGDLAEVLGSFPVWMTGIAFLFYAPLEFAVSTWGTTYLTVDQGYKERTAALLMSLFWLAFLGSRVLMTVVLHERYLNESRAPWLLFLLAVLASAMLGYLAGAGKLRTTAWAVVVLGFALGPIFPTLVALVLRESPGREAPGTAYGAMFAIGSLGSAVLAPVLGVLARKSVLRALRVLAPVGLLLIVATLALLGSMAGLR